MKVDPAITLGKLAILLRSRQNVESISVMDVNYIVKVYWYGSLMPVAHVFLEHYSLVYSYRKDTEICIISFANNRKSKTIYDGRLAHVAGKPLHEYIG